ncbi:FtsX-like permease family protein [Fulvimarina sp. 2208YS6-2-32]|uniref:FtsX-like permease family protein n=1 Tax=Fulvimarina uroteuthidis TaxID=3098149 RepID=A0ABU5I4I1_9HYPH|nr:FtsX-like permease family protein [Fulvimarina sp. 2208YS6-2-32]MDY8109071.1 FtsX-like permease family protein [Fulvimarina sp. 2208YS6-2-32]
MIDFAGDWWSGLPALAQDLLWLCLLAAPGLLLGVLVVAGHRPFALAAAMAKRFTFTSLLFGALIAVSVGIGTGLIAQERALREGTARAADPFDLVIAAPGSEITAMLAAVYLEASDVPLVPGDLYAEIADDPRVAIAAPIGFGDHLDGAPVVGTTPQFVAHLAGEPAQGRMFADHFEAVAGALAPLGVGDRFTPRHGTEEAEGEAGDHHDHEGYEFSVVGRMAPTGSPWDRALLVPIEAVWEVHGLANGHAPEHEEQVGPPFDAAYFPGTPAILVTASELTQAYALRATYQTERTMAFFPGAVLSSLYGLLGDVREAMSVLAIVTQVLVTAGVLAGLVILSRLFARQMALLRALGAPSRFVFAVVWSYAAVLILAGSGAGLLVGYGAARIISAIVSARTDILIEASLGWTELHLVAGFVSLTLVIALLPATIALMRPPVADLRA